MSIMPVGGWKPIAKEGEVVTSSTQPIILVQQAKQRSPFAKMFLGCLGLICALWFAEFCTGFATGFVKGFNRTWNAAQQKTLSVQSTYEVSAAQLNYDYEANEVAADAKYKNRTLRVYGYAKSINKDVMGSTYITIADGDLFGVQATLNATAMNEDIAINLTRGQSVTVSCSSIQYFGTIVMLRSCDFTP